METNTKNKIITIPNLMSLFRILLIPIMLWLYCERQKYMLTAALLVLSGITDVLDGYIARKFNMVSDLGKLLDPSADKLTQAAMLICLMTRFPGMRLPLVLLIIKEVVNGTIGLFLTSKTGEVFGAECYGKVATVLLYATLFLHIIWATMPPMLSDLLIAVCAVLIFLSFILYFRRNVMAWKAHSAVGN